ncbi:MAG: bacillithiol biosynthesis cysteine-adding enzyme BshC [Bacteroidetes bacterium]|nr:bacillithiol biosynthesis cysteine-adding enzyme BshC [Bacteroidota bacterium]
MPLQPIDPEKSGLYSSLVLDYLNRKDSLRQFISNWPDKSGFKNQIDRRANQLPDRTVLVQALRRQYASLELGSQVEANLKRLEADNSYTLTTGQQIHIFLGPMYVYWKIVSTIALCQKLKKDFPDQEFIPVFWMATEDHDFAEINHLELFNRNFEWESPSDRAMPVGALSTLGLPELTDEVNELFHRQESFQPFAALFKEAYSRYENFAAATRYLVHSLFREFGLLIIDPMDEELKKQFDSILRDELVHGFAQQAVEKTSEELGKMYSLQVHPREINLFYTGLNGRERVENSSGMIQTISGEKIGRLEEIHSWLPNKRRDFSTNVVLRPVYQETILPNLAYIGGPGELAYWLQLKEVFEAYQVPFPILENRKSIFLLGKKSVQNWEKSGLPWDALFEEESTLRKMLLEASNDGLVSLAEDLEELHRLKDKIIGKSASIQPSSAKPLANIFNQTEKIIKKIDKEIFTLQEAGQLKNLEKLIKVRSVLKERGFNQERNHGVIQYISELKTDKIIGDINKNYEDIGPVALLLEAE